MAKPIPVQKKKVVAKGKIRRDEIQADEDALAQHEKKMLKPQQSDQAQGAGKNEISTKEIINVVADEIEAIYEGTPFKIDRMNAEDKARTLIIELRCHQPIIRITEHEFDVPDCGRHDEED
jgi:hypothetical protein